MSPDNLEVLRKTTMFEPTTPESTLPYPPIHEDKQFIVLSDWSVHLRNES